MTINQQRVSLDATRPLTRHESCVHVSTCGIAEHSGYPDQQYSCVAALPTVMGRKPQWRPTSSSRVVDSALPVSDLLISKWRVAQSRSRLYRCAKCSAAAACPQSQPALLATKPNTTSRTIRTRQPIPIPVPMPIVEDGPLTRSALRESVGVSTAESSSAGRSGACSGSVTSNASYARVPASRCTVGDGCWNHDRRLIGWVRSRARRVP